MGLKTYAHRLAEMPIEAVAKHFDAMTSDIIRDTVLAEMFRWVAVLNKFRRAL